jgi:hypothetical protein
MDFMNLYCSMPFVVSLLLCGYWLQWLFEGSG